MKRKLSIAVMTACAVVALGAAPTTPAAADSADEKVYGAFGCMEKGRETGAFNRSDYRVTRTGTAGSGRLLCPIVRDVVGSSSTGYDDGGWGDPVRSTGYRVKVRTYRTLRGPTVRLTLWSRNYTGSILSYRTKYAYEGHQETELWTSSSADDGYYLLEAEMGTNSGSSYAKLYSYKVYE